MTGVAETWRRLPFSQAEAGRQLALSESLLTNLDQPSLYWYVAERPALILGAAQLPALLDLNACRRAGMAVYKRTSGGATVWAGPPFLSLDVALPSFCFLHDRDITKAYGWLGQTWQAALTRLGLLTESIYPGEARVANKKLDKQPEIAALLRQVCFGTLSPYEVTTGLPRRKLVGLAQVRRRYGSLFQCGLPLVWSSEAFAAWFALSPVQKRELAEALDQQAVGLDALLTDLPAIETIIAAFEATLTERYPIGLASGLWTPDELAQADQLQQTKYLNLLD